MLKILQGRLQQYVSQEIPDVQAGFRKGTGTRDQIACIHWITEIGSQGVGHNVETEQQVRKHSQRLGGNPIPRTFLHSSILAWKIPWVEEPRPIVHGVAKESDMT